jgi:hypothetical protein
MKRRLILICMLAVIALGAYVAYAYVQGAAPFEKPQKATSDPVVTAASATGACQHNCNPADCQKCPNMQGGQCAMGQGQACPGMAAGKCQGASGAAGAGMKSGSCPGMTAAGCPGAAAAGCAVPAAAGCQAAKSAGMCAGKSACGSSCPMTK